MILGFIIFEIVFWVLYYVNTRSVKSDIELFGKEL
nr:MAG TPA: Photosystem II reaction centre W protein (PsbW) [Caudoviricetes sp.]